MWNRILFFSVMTVLISCGSDSNKNGGFQGNYYGTETGTRAGQQFSSNVSVSLTENSSQISGNLTVNGYSNTGNNNNQGGFGNQQTASGVSGALSGFVVGNEVRNLILTLNENNCRGNLVGTGTLNGTDLAATLTGTGSCGEMSVTLSIRRQ